MMAIYVTLPTSLPSFLDVASLIFLSESLLFQNLLSGNTSALDMLIDSSSSSPGDDKLILAASTGRNSKETLDTMADPSMGVRYQIEEGMPYLFICRMTFQRKSSLFRKVLSAKIGSYYITPNLSILTSYLICLFMHAFCRPHFWHTYGSIWGLSGCPDMQTSLGDQTGWRFSVLTMYGRWEDRVGDAPRQTI